MLNTRLEALQRRLKHGPLILDGGLSTALEAAGHSLDDPLWTARLLDQDPQAIVDAHLSYLHAGADIIITASYQTSLAGFLEAGYTEQKAEALLLKSVDLAQQAVAVFMDAAQPDTPRPLIAGSFGTYGAYLADGSEYRGNYAVGDDELREFHRWRIELLKDSAIDCFACETLPDAREAHILSKLIRQTEVPAWLSFSCKDDAHLHDGTPISGLAQHFDAHPNLFALGINCTAPEHVSGLIENLKANLQRLHILVYPNSGEVYDASTKTWSGLNETGVFRQSAEEWLETGAQLIGGCCRIGPGHIRELSELKRP